MKLPSRSLSRWLIPAALAIAALVAALLWNPSPQTPEGPRDLTRSELDMRDGVLFAHDEARPFLGHLIENYPDGARKLMIDVQDGRLHGHSLGWYPVFPLSSFI